MRIVIGFLIALAAAAISGASLAQNLCDDPNGTLILVRQENMCDRNGSCTNVNFMLERDGNKMRGRARYNGGGNAPGRSGLVTGEIGANGGMYWQVHWDDGEIGTYKGTLVNGAGEGVTHGDQMLYYKYIAATAKGCSKWSYLDLNPPPPPKTFIKLGKAKAWTGDWVTVANGGTWSFSMNFRQSGDQVEGSFTVIETGVTGGLTGRVSGRVLSLTWQDANGYAGTGTLTLSSDGREFDGTYQVTYLPPDLTADLLEGTWHGSLQVPLPDETQDYGACPGCEGPEEFPVVK